MKSSPIAVPPKRRGTAASSAFRDRTRSVIWKNADFTSPRLFSGAAIWRFPSAAPKSSAAAAASAVDDVLLGRFLLFFSTFETRIAEQEKDTLYLYTEQACQYISENYAFALTVDDIADHVKVDRSYLYRLFKKRFGMSVQNYLLAVRLRNAACLLESSDMLTSEVCYASGFNDYSHFSKMFAKAYNMSPKDYRQRARQERNASELNA